MSSLKTVKLTKDVENILKTRFGDQYTDILTNIIYLADKGDISKDDLMLKKDKEQQGGLWNLVYEMTNVRSKIYPQMPLLIYKYMYHKCLNVQADLKRFSRKSNISLEAVLQYYKKQCNKVTESKRKFIRHDEKRPSLLTSLMRSKTRHNTNKSGNDVNFLKNLLGSQVTNCKRHSMIQSDNLFNIVGTQIKKTQENSSDDDSFQNIVDTKKNFENLKKKNKINIFVGDYESYSGKTQNDTEKVKVFEGNLCSTYMLKPGGLNNVHDKERDDMRTMVNSGKGIFIPTDKMKILKKPSKSGNYKNLVLPLHNRQISGVKSETCRALINPSKHYRTGSNFEPISFKKSTYTPRFSTHKSKQVSSYFESTSKESVPPKKTKPQDSFTSSEKSNFLISKESRVTNPSFTQKNKMNKTKVRFNMSKINETKKMQNFLTSKDFYFNK